jgi:hypothetical protein
MRLLLDCCRVGLLFPCRFPCWDQAYEFSSFGPTTVSRAGRGNGCGHLLEQLRPYQFPHLEQRWERGQLARLENPPSFCRGRNRQQHYVPQPRYNQNINPIYQRRICIFPFSLGWSTLATEIVLWVRGLWEATGLEVR